MFIESINQKAITIQAEEALIKTQDFLSSLTVLWVEYSPIQG